jgi:hypothetical protein
LAMTRIRNAKLRLTEGHARGDARALETEELR